MARKKKFKYTDPLKGRDATVVIRLSEEELDVLHEASDQLEASVQYWARTRLLASADVEKGEDATEVWDALREREKADD